MFDYETFIRDATRSYYKESHSQRYGQYLMNKLPLEMKIPEPYDCYHDDKKVPALLEYLYRLSQQS